VVKLFADHDQLRKKFYHAKDVNSPIPKKLANGELERLANNSIIKERLKAFTDKKILPDSYVDIDGKLLREHLLDPNTIKIEGTLGANRDLRTNGKIPKIHGSHYYNPETGFNVFVSAKGNRYRTGFSLKKGQKKDLNSNSNVL
jgi:hypothetical protein